MIEVEVPKLVVLTNASYQSPLLAMAATRLEEAARTKKPVDMIGKLASDLYNEVFGAQVLNKSTYDQALGAFEMARIYVGPDSDLGQRIKNQVNDINEEVQFESLDLPQRPEHF